MPQGISLNQFKAVLFDVDGTLVDSIGGLVSGLHDTFLAFGNQGFSRSDIRQLVGRPLRDQMRLALGESASESQLQDAMEYAMARYLVHQAGSQVFESAVKTLESVHRAGYKTALVTSKNALEMKSFLPKFSATSYVDATVCASDVKQPKPSSDSAYLACELLGVLPSEAVMIGDSIYDLQCAKAAGVAAIAVSYGSMTKEMLLNEAPDAIFHSPEELLEWTNQSIFDQHEKNYIQEERLTG